MEGKAQKPPTEPKRDYVELSLVPVPSDVTQLELLEQQLPLVRKLCAVDSDCDTELEDGRAWKASKACAYVEGVKASTCASSSLPCTRPSKGFLPFPKLEPHPAHRATLSSEVHENSETPAGRAAGGPGGDGNSPTLSTSTFVVSLDVASGERNVKAAERAELLGWPPREPGVSSFLSLKRSSFVVKALPCAQGELFPLLSKEGGMRLDMRLDIERTVAEMGALLHIGGHWHDPLHGKFAICSVVQDAKNKMSCRMFSIKDGPLSEKVKVELTQQRHTSSRACVDQKMVVDVNEALAACLLALPNTIWIKPPSQWGPHVQLAMSQKYRLTSANVFGGIDLNFSSVSKELDLVRLAAHLQSPRNIYSGKISTHKVIDTVPDEKYHLGQLGVTVDTSLLRNWNPPDSSKMATVFVWVYKTGKCNATNFPLCVKTHTPPLQCAEELSDLLANTIYHAAECDPSILLTPQECNHKSKLAKLNSKKNKERKDNLRNSI